MPKALTTVPMEPGYDAVSSGSWEAGECVFCVREGERGDEGGEWSQNPKGLKVKLTFKGVHRVV